MTIRRYRICKYAIRHRNLNRILRKFHISDYLEIQDILGVGHLEFSDGNMDDNTEITLDDELTNEYEEFRRRIWDMHFTKALAILALIISILALLGQLGILKLQGSSLPM